MKGLSMHGLVLAACLFACVQSWTLTTTHEGVAPGFTTDVALKCLDGDDSRKGSGNSQDVYRIRILKLDGDNRWTTFALKGKGVATVSATGLGVSTTGLIDKPENSFLSVTWSQALKETVGVYKCEVTDLNFVPAFSMEVNITTASVSFDDVLSIVLKNKLRSSKVQELLQKVEEVAMRSRTHEQALNDTREDIKKALHELKSELNDYISSADRRFTSLHKTITQDIDSLIQSKIEENFYEARTWPVGQVAFPAPESGCPADNGVDQWLDGVITVDRSGGSFHPNFSRGNHLLKPLTSGPGNLQLRFCKKNSHAGGRDWPSGTYCVARAAARGLCPIHFDQKSYINFQSMSNQPKYQLRITNVNGPNYSRSYIALWVMFCCRNDSSATIPIELPTEQPFYLYRYGGQCQTVLDADVTNEVMTLATVFENLKVEWPLPIHPDGTNGAIELCYYTPRNASP